MDQLSLDEALEELSSAEDFLDYFGIAHDPAVVRVNRLHILQRFHDYIAKAGELPAAATTRRDLFEVLLNRAYNDFVVSDARTEKVFKVFHMHEPQTAFVPIASIGRAQPAARIDAGGCGCGNTGPCHGSQAAASGM